MAGQEKSFKDLQQDERIKRLERQLKLNQVKQPHSSRRSTFTHMSISGISSIHGDNALSDFSFAGSQTSSSTAGSVILASSLNLRKNLSKNLTNRTGARSPTAASSPPVVEQSPGRQKLDDDRAMMPPPSVLNGHKSQTSDKTEKPKIRRAADSLSKQSCAQNYDSENHSVDETYRSEHDLTVERQRSPKEPSRSHDISKQQGRAWKNWIVRLNENGQIIVKGKLESGDGARSKAIKKRVNATTVMSVFNHLYRLVGDMHDVREELPEYIRGKFYNGFPTDWENVRQVWRSYVISGYSLSFRWPTPITDSDDDLRSDVTELTVCRSKNSKITPTSPLLSPRPLRDTREIGRSISNGESLKRQKSTPSDTTLPESKRTEFKTSSGNTEERIIPAPSNRSIRNSEVGNTQSFVCGRIPKCKVDVIVDNLMNKNCSIEFVEKFITAVNCFNELLALPPTIDVETAPDEGVSLNYNSNSQMDKTNNETVNRVEPWRVQYRKESAAGPSNSFSLESVDSEEEPASEHETFVCNGQRLRKRLFSTPVRPLTTGSDTRRLEQNEKQNAATLSRGEVSEKTKRKNRHQQRPIFETTDTDGETVVDDKARTISAYDSSLATSSRRVRHQLVATGKMDEGVKGCKPDARCDSDISLVGTSGTPSAKRNVSSNGTLAENPSKRIHEEVRQQSNVSSTNDEKNDRSQANSPVATRSTNLNNKITLHSSTVQAGDKRTVQLTKISSAQKRNRGSSSLSKSENTSKGHQNRRTIVDKEQVGSDSENVNMRTSSRGRRILPPLHYWEGERLSLKGQKLVYNPGADRLRTASANSSVLKNSSIVSNRTAVSEPGLSTTIAGKSSEMPSGQRERSKYTVESTIENIRRTDGVLLEISPNRDGNNDHSVSPDQKTRQSSRRTMPEDAKRNKNSATIREKLDSSSDDERMPVRRQRKRRRIH